MYDASSQPPNIDKIKGALLYLDFRNQNPNDKNITLDYAKTNNVNQWDPAVISLSDNISRTENYYRTLFNWNSIDNKGMNIVSIFHFRWATQGGGSHNDNACWNPNVKALYFGDGDKYDGGIMPHDIDTVAHEYTHGITDFTANLIYENQSGALHEHFSDFFACMVDRDDWLIGEDTQSSGKIALRDVQNPGNPDVLSPLPATMADYRYMPVDQDNGGVHINMGIPGRMSYLMAEGPYGISREKAERIVNRAQTQYLTQRGQFVDYRRAAISAATDFHGEGSAEVEAVKKAFDEVGITEGAGTPPSTPGQPTSGVEAVLFLVADPFAGWDPFREDFFYKLAINAQGQNQLLAPRYVANTRPVASGDGQWGLYVDAFNNIFWTDGETEEQLTQDGIVRTISMSKNLRYVAFTTIDYANCIYILDTQAQQTTQVPLSVPVKDAANVDLKFADVMTFNFRGDNLIYDAISEIKLGSGESYFAWGIFGLRLADLTSYLVMPQKTGEQIGNPVFSHTMDHLLLADLETIENNQSAYHIIALDFNQGKIGALLTNMTVMARPAFRGDDRHIVFRTTDQAGSTYYLLESTLASDNLSLEQGNPTTIYSDSVPIDYPYAFRIGEYESQEGKISVPASIVFGDVPVQKIAETTMEVANQGNGDLQLLGITLEGANPDWFAHNGANQVIPPGAKFQFQVACSPQREGPFGAVMRIKSTDLNQPEVTVQLNGIGVAPTGPTATTPPTPTPAALPPTQTPTPSGIPPTPTPTSTPLPGPGPSLEPIVAYEFDKMDLAANGWKEIAGGLAGAPPGQISSLAFVGSMIPSSQDKVGIKITVNPTQVAFMHALAPVETGGSPVLIRMTVRASAPGAAIALAALKGNLAAGATDWSIATHIPTTASSSIANERQMVLVYEPDSGNTVTPIIQVAATGQEGPVTVLVDKLEVFRIDSTAAWSGSMFGSAPLPTSPPSPGTIPPSVDVLYEFDKMDLAGNEWKEVPGGLLGAAPGQVSAYSFLGQQIPSSNDKVGIMISVDPNEVAFIHALTPIDTGGWPVLIRMTVRADNPNAAIALAALKGNLAAGATDWSIATHIPTTAASCVAHERRMVLVYEPDSGQTVTPIIQVAATGQTGAVNVLIDKLDVVRLPAVASYFGSLFSSAASDVPVVTGPTFTPVVPTPSPAPGLPTPTPAAASPTSAPTPAGVRIPEQEPNDAQAQPQNLGTLSAGQSIVVTGRMSTAGVQGDRYIGDSDFYSFTLPSRLTVSATLDWSLQADLDLYLWSGGQIIARDDSVDKPTKMSITLDAGTYLFLVLAIDNPTDYSLTLTAAGQEGSRSDPTPTPRGPTPTPVRGGISEREPNDTVGQAQDLGALSVGATTTVSGNVSRGGRKPDGSYSGDSDVYKFNLTAQADVTVTLDWTGQADLDLLAFNSSGELIDYKVDTAKPVKLSGPLSPGLYALLVVSKDNPADYQFTLTATQSTAAYSNDVSILSGKYNQDPASLLWWYTFDGQGNYGYWGWTPLSGEMPVHSGTYSISYPYLILNHDGKSEQHQLQFESPGVFILDGQERYVREGEGRTAANTATPIQTAKPGPTPTVPPSVHPYKGTYNIEIQGEGTGSGSIQIDDNGNVSGSARTESGLFAITGTASLDGALAFFYEQNREIVGGGTGSIQGVSGTGWWEDFEGDRGTWTTTRVSNGGDITQTAPLHPYTGTYNVQIRGDNTGSGSVTVDGKGNLLGSIRTTETILLTGSVSLNGSVTLVYQAGGEIVGGGKGTIAGGSGSGLWRDYLGFSGSWSAVNPITLQPR
jgi:hypothetical protein